MSRLYYDDDWGCNIEGLQQGWLRSAIRGKRGQQFLRELVTALDALPIEFRNRRRSRHAPLVTTHARLQTRFKSQ